MAVKASVDTSNQTTVRVGQQNATKVTTTQTGIASAVTADTAFNVVGGRADVAKLAVSGLSTFTGIGTFVGDLYVGGDLYLTDDLVLDQITGNSLIISGISSVGFLTATDVWVSGAVTATSYYGDGTNLTGVARTDNINADTLVVSGVSTLGVTSATDLEAQQLSVSGISTFNEDVVFTGANTNARWDHSTSDLILFDNTRLEFGSNKDFEIWHGGSHTFLKNTGGDLRIRGDVIKLAREDGSERYLEAYVNNEVKLFYNGVEKFSTTLTGIEIGNVSISTTGIVTATTYYGDGQHLTGVGNTLNVSTNSLVVSGISTLGVTSVTDLEAQQLSVTGVTTFNQDVKFPGAAYNIHWDQPTSKFKFDDSAQCVWGSKSGGDLRIWHASDVSNIKNETGEFRIAGNDIRLQSQDNSADYLLAVDGGSVSIFHNDIKRLETSGIGITVTGVTSTTDLYVTGITTVGFATATDVWVSGAVTATSFYGDGTNLTGVARTDNINADSIYVTGITTVGFVTATDVWVSGAVTATSFNGSLATTDLTGTITNAQLEGSIANGKLVHSSVNYGGITLSLGSTDATPAFDLSDANNYPYTSLTGIVTHIVGDTTPQLGGNLDGNSKSIYDVDNLKVTGISTLAGITTVTGDTLFTKQLSVSGLSTYIGVATYKSNVFIDGTLTAGAIDGGTY